MSWFVSYLISSYNWWTNPCGCFMEALNRLFLVGLSLAITLFILFWVSYVIPHAATSLRAPLCLPCWANNSINIEAWRFQPTSFLCRPFELNLELQLVPHVAAAVWRISRNVKCRLRILLNLMSRTFVQSVLGFKVRTPVLIIFGRSRPKRLLKVIPELLKP